MEQNNSRRHWQILAGILTVAVVIMIFSFHSFNQELVGLAAIGAAPDNHDNPIDLNITRPRLVVQDQLPGQVVYVALVTAKHL